MKLILGFFSADLIQDSQKGFLMRAIGPGIFQQFEKNGQTLNSKSRVLKRKGFRSLKRQFNAFEVLLF